MTLKKTLMMTLMSERPWGDGYVPDHERPWGETVTKTLMDPSWWDPDEDLENERRGRLRISRSEARPTLYRIDVYISNGLYERALYLPPPNQDELINQAAVCTASRGPSAMGRDPLGRDDHELIETDRAIWISIYSSKLFILLHDRKHSALRS